MSDHHWWRGTDSPFGARLIDFMLALHGLNKAVRRLEADDDPHTAIECCWWIGAAAEACGHHDIDNILAGFYWVRNKGIHTTAKAMGQILPEGRNELEPGVVLITPESRWLPLDGPEDGRREQFNRYLARNSISGTITDAQTLLLTIWDDARTEAGLDGITP